jgi:hypothetical protein
MLQSSPIFGVFGPSAILVLANDRLNSRAEEMYDACPPSRVAARRAATACRFARCRHAPRAEPLPPHSYAACRGGTELMLPPAAATWRTSARRPRRLPPSPPICRAPGRTAPLPWQAASPPRSPCSRCHIHCLRAERRKTCTRQARAGERAVAPLAMTKMFTRRGVGRSRGGGGR